MKIRYSVLLAIALFLLCSTSVTALDLQTCIDKALEQNPELKQGLVDLRAAEREARQNWSLLLPSVTANGGVAWSDSVISEPASPALAAATPWSASFGLTVTLPLNAGIPFSMKQNTLSRTAEEISYEMARDATVRQVSKLFYSLIMLRENLDLLEENVRLSERQVEQVETGFDNGLIGERTVLQSRLALESTRVGYEQQKMTYESQKRDFFLLIGFDPGPGQTLEGELDFTLLKLDGDSLAEKYLHRRKDLQALQTSLGIMELQKKQYTAALKTPSINLSGRWTGNVTDSFLDNLNFGLTLSAPLDSLIPGSRDDQSVKALSDSIEKARLQLEYGMNNARLGIKNLVASLESAESSINLAETQVEISERYFSLAEEGFQYGTVERMELEQARQDLLSARQQLLQKKYEYTSLQIDLLAALNIKDVEEFRRLEAAQ